MSRRYYGERRILVESRPDGWYVVASRYDLQGGAWVSRDLEGPMTEQRADARAVEIATEKPEERTPTTRRSRPAPSRAKVLMAKMVSRLTEDAREDL